MVRRAAFMFLLLPGLTVLLLAACSGGSRRDGSLTRGESSSPPVRQRALPPLPEDRLQPWERLTPEGYVDPFWVAGKVRSFPDPLAGPAPSHGEKSTAAGFTPATFLTGQHYFRVRGKAQNPELAVLSLMPAGDPFAWVIYRLPMGGNQPTILTVDAVPSGWRYWFALSDYGHGRWAWRGPYTQHHLRILLDRDTNYLSDLGNLFVALYIDGDTGDALYPLSIVGVGAQPVDPTDTTPPSAPTGLAAQAVPGGVYLSWDPVADADLAGYRLYWSEGPFGQPEEALGSTGDRLLHRPEVLLPNPLPAGASLTFRITALDRQGNESPLSDPASATLQAGSLPPAEISLSRRAGDSFLESTLTLTVTGAASYDFDEEGDGTYDTTDSPSDRQDILILDEGIWRPTARARDASGNPIALLTTSAYVIDPSLAPPTLSLTAEPGSGVPPLTTDLAINFRDRFGAVEQVLLDLDGDGTFETDVSGEGPTSLPAELGLIRKSQMLGEGTHWINATAIDDDGNRGMASTRVVVGTGDLPPAPFLQFSPNPLYLGITGSIPFDDPEATLDASLSTDPDGGALEFSFDPTGSGSFTPFSSDPTLTATYSEPGLLFPQVRVRDASGKTTLYSSSTPLEVYRLGRSFWLEQSGETGVGIEAGFVTCNLFLGGTCPAASFTDGRNRLLFARADKFLNLILGWSVFELDTEVGEPTSLTRVVDGRPAVVYTKASGLRYGVNSDATGFGSWNFSDVAPDQTSHFSLAFINNRPMVAYANDAGLQLAVNSTSDGLGTWTSSEIAAASGDNFTYPSLAQVDGKPAVAYRDPSTNSLLYSINELPDGSGAWDTFTVDSGGSRTGEFASLAVVGGLPMVAYAKDSTLYLAINDQPDGRGTWSVQQIPGVGEPLDISLAQVSGNPAIAVIESGLDQNRVLYLRNDQPDGSGSWSLVEVELLPQSIFSTHVSLLEDPAGTPYLAYTRFFELFSKVAAAYLNDQPDGSGTPNYQVIEYGGGYGIGGLDTVELAGGKVGVFFYEHDQKDLLFVLDTPDFAEFPTTVDAAGDVGRNPSAYLINGLPAASYYDATDRDIKFALNDQPDGLGSWLVSTVETDDGVSSYSGLATVQCGTTRCPAVFYVLNNDLWMAVNDQPDGSGAWTKSRLEDAMTIDPDYVSTQPVRAATINGLPAVLASESTDGAVVFHINDSPDGTGSWTWTSFSILGGDPFLDYDLAEVDGRPAMTRNSPDGGLAFDINEQPDGTGSWNGVGIFSPARGASLTIVGGRPAVGFWNPDQRVFMFAISDTPDGEVNWREYPAYRGDPRFMEPGEVRLSGLGPNRKFPKLYIANRKSGDLDYVTVFR